jgi:hypothetical protein
VTGNQYNMRKRSVARHLTATLLPLTSHLFFGCGGDVLSFEAPEAGSSLEPPDTGLEDAGPASLNDAALTGLGTASSVACGSSDETPGVPCTLTSGQNAVAIAVDSESVYWTNGVVDGSVVKVPIGGGIPTTLAGGQTNAFGIALYGGNVYWSDMGIVSETDEGGVTPNAGTLMSVPVEGGPTSTLTSALDIQNTTAVTTSDTNLYWLSGRTVDPPPGPSVGYLMNLPLAGGTPTTVASDQFAGRGVTADSANIYWLANENVMMIPVGGGQATTLAGQVNGASIASNGGNVYWTCSQSDQPGLGTPTGSVSKVSITGGAPVVLASGLPGPTAIAVDGVYVYWTNAGSSENDYSDGSVMKIPVGGGTPTVVASSLFPQAIAVDATSLYWGISGGTCIPGHGVCSGAVMKLTPK